MLLLCCFAFIVLFPKSFFISHRLSSCSFKFYSQGKNFPFLVVIFLFTMSFFITQSSSLKVSGSLMIENRGGEMSSFGGVSGEKAINLSRTIWVATPTG